MNRLLFVFISICYVASLTSQTVGEVLEIRDASQYNWDLSPGEAVKDEDGNYYYYQTQFAKSSDPNLMTNGGINFNGINMERGPLLDTISQYSYFVYIMKFSPDFELLATNTIMNVNRVESISVNHGHFSIVIQTRQNFPLIVGNKVYQSSDMSNESWVLVFDENLERVETIHYPNNAVKSANLGKEKGEIFIGLQLNELSNFVVLGEDTVWNYSDTIAPGIEYSPYTGVVASYNFLENRYSWTSKFGDVWGGSLIKQIRVDTFGDIIVLGISGASSYVYIDDRKDSLPAKGITLDRETVAESVLIKYSPSGEYIWGITTPEAQWDVIQDFSLDQIGNVYIYGWHYNDSLTFQDTILISNPDTYEGFDNRSILAKFRRDGTYDWVSQFQGAYSEGFYSKVNAGAPDFLYVSGGFRFGDIILGDSVIQHDMTSLFPSFITYKIDKGSGKEELIYQSNSTLSRIIEAIPIDNDKALLLINTSDRIELFGIEYESPGNVVFIKVDLKELVNSNENIANDKTVMVYPNPIECGNTLKIQLDHMFIGQKVQLQIQSMDGKVVLNKKIDIKDTKFLEVTIPEGLKQSAYLLYLNGNKIKLGRILIIK
jgi:hypothetical protein